MTMLLCFTNAFTVNTNAIGKFGTSCRICLCAWRIRPVNCMCLQNGWRYIALAMIYSDCLPLRCLQRCLWTLGHWWIVLRWPFVLHRHQDVSAHSIFVSDMRRAIVSNVHFNPRRYALCSPFGTQTPHLVLIVWHCDMSLSHLVFMFFSYQVLCSSSLIGSLFVFTWWSTV